MKSAKLKTTNSEAAGASAPATEDSGPRFYRVSYYLDGKYVSAIHGPQEALVATRQAMDRGANTVSLFAQDTPGTGTTQST